MTVHYHGLPITPQEVLLRLAGCCFCVSYAAPQQVKSAHQIGQAVMLDNGAFSLWRAGTPTDWPGFYRWADEWLDHPTTWAVIPDVIEGGEEENDSLVSDWPFGNKGAPVWHLHESIDRLLRLADAFPQVCFGSSGEYAEIGTWDWHSRISEAFNELSVRHKRLPWIHMLRGMSLAGGPYPFASLDSTNIARNHAGNHTGQCAEGRPADGRHHRRPAMSWPLEPPTHPDTDSVAGKGRRSMSKKRNHPRKRDSARTTAQRVLEALTGYSREGEMPSREIVAGRLALGVTALDNALDQLIASGEISRQGRGRSLVYTLKTGQTLRLVHCHRSSREVGRALGVREEREAAQRSATQVQAELRALQRAGVWYGPRMAAE